MRLVAALLARPGPVWQAILTRCHSLRCPVSAKPPPSTPTHGSPENSPPPAPPRASPPAAGWGGGHGEPRVAGGGEGCGLGGPLLARPGRVWQAFLTRCHSLRCPVSAKPPPSPPTHGPPENPPPPARPRASPPAAGRGGANSP